MIVARLTALLWRRGGARQRATLALTAAGVLASTVLALLALSVSPALGDRADRTAWRTPSTVRAGHGSLAVERVGEDTYGGDTIVRVDLAPLPRAVASDPGADGTLLAERPAPPGLDAFPAPGTLWASPALARLLASPEGADLVGRYPGRLAGTIGPEGLAHAEELVVVVGRPAGALDGQLATGPVVPINGFATMAADTGTASASSSDDDTETYRTLAQLAAVLLVVPTILLVGAAARLTAAQRQQRLAALRLAGATPGTVVGVTAVEIAGAAALGTGAGIAAYLALLPVAARIPLAGGPFSPDDLRLSAWSLTAAGLAVPLLAVVTAVVALRSVVAGPLGATRRSAPRRPRLVRFLVVPVAWALFVVAARDMRAGGSSTGALVGLGAVILTLSVIGPWVAWAIGALLTRVARGPATLIAGRRITDDHRAAYRTVSGMVLAGLIAGFLFGVLPTIDSVALPDGEGPRLYALVAVDQREAVTEAALSAGGLAWWHGSDEEYAERDGRVPPPEGDEDGSFVEVAGDGSESVPLASGTIVVADVGRIDEVRTAVLRAVPDAGVTAPYDLGSERLLLADLGRASTILSLAALVMATAAAGIGGAAAILDQRLTLARLRLVGTPVAVLQRARRWQVLVPLVLASAGAMAFGAGAGVVLLAAFGATAERIQPPDLTSMALLGAVAVAAGLAVVAATRPLLVAVSRTTPRE